MWDSVDLSHGELHWHPHALKTPYALVRSGRLPLGSLPLGSLKELGVDLRNQHPGSFRLSVLVKYLPGGDVKVAVVKVDRPQELGFREFPEALMWENLDYVG